MSTVDGNALAGDLADVFTVDATAVVMTCAGCGHSAAVAQLRVWGPAPGQVARCPACDDVVLKLVRAPGRLFLDLRGALRLEVSLP